MGERKSKLLETKNQVSNLQSGWNLKYLHFRSVDNFIFHFDQINNEADKQWIFDTLINYFIVCKEIDEVVDREMGNQLYSEFLDKIANYYRYKLNFIMAINKVGYFIFFLIIFFLAGFLFSFLIASFIIPMYILFLIYIDRKQKQKKVYGVFY